ncbi:MAG: SLC13 family permease [Actinomycetota bacterium]|nr:SLC13 family permease [Actinomycetota bacterium]
MAVFRPRGLSEATVAVPAAGLAVLIGLITAHNALQRLREIGPTVGFLSAILVFGHLCAEAGVFSFLGAVTAKRSGTSQPRLLALVVAVCAIVTAVLTLDATVVLLTPVILTTVHRLSVPARPYLYACTRIANSGSLLLPVSNLTNLLAFSASGLSFGRFAALMVLPWLIACSGEWYALRRFFHASLAAPAEQSGQTDLVTPRYALAVLALTVVLFVVSSSTHVAPAWAAVVGCGLLLVPRLRRREVHLRALVREANPGFCAFVLALAVVVEAVTQHGLRHGLGDVLPSGTGLAALLGVACVAAVLANLVNNLPATLALLPLVAAQPALVLAVLIGVNVGPNATYAGSLATLLWRRILPPSDKPLAGEFHRFGLISTPAVVLTCTIALWAALSAIGT